MSDLNITIKGLALCCPVGPMTQILFPHAPKHSLRLTIDNGRETIDEDFFPEGFMTMTTESGVISIPPPTESGDAPVNRLIDLNELHNGFPDIKLKNRADVKRRIAVSYLSVPTDTLFSQTKAGRKHEIWVKKSGAAGPERSFISLAPNGGILHNEVKISFRIPATDPAGVPAVKLNVRQPYVHSYTFQHAVDPNDPLTVRDYNLTFDNHCHGQDGQSSRSDFEYYYEIVEAIDSSGVKFEIEELPVRRMSSIDSDSEAACNPVMGKPGGDMEVWHQS